MIASIMKRFLVNAYTRKPFVISQMILPHPERLTDRSRSMREFSYFNSLRFNREIRSHSRRPFSRGKNLERVALIAENPYTG